MVISAALVLALSRQDAPRPVVPLEVRYGQLPGQELVLHLPTGPRFPTVVFVYGGGWHSGSGKSGTPVAERLAARGYGCALLSHRLYPPDLWPAMIEDVAQAFAWVHEHVGEHGGDPQRLFLVGHSSGAQLALLLATDPRWLAAHGLSAANVVGVVGLSTPLDLEPHGDGQGYGDVLMSGRGAEVFGRDASALRAASPMRHLTATLPPTLLVVGERDFPMLAGDARDFVGAAGDLGVEVLSFTAPGRDHLGVVQSLAEEESPAARAVFSFLDRLAFPEEARRGSQAQR